MGSAVPLIWQNCQLAVPVIWQNCLYSEECANYLAALPVCGKGASDLTELPVQVIWQNCLSVFSVYVEECASDLTELPVPVIWQKCLCQ